MSTCTDVEDFAVVFDVLRDDVAEVGPVLVPVEFRAVSDYQMESTMRSASTRRSACRNGCSSQNTWDRFKY